jgi:Flp pilus assembly protein TadG
MVRRTARRSNTSGQAALEFALALPVLVIFLAGIIAGGFFVFSMSSANIAVTNAAQIEAQLGNAADADTKAVAAIRAGISGAAHIAEIDVYRLKLSSNGTFAPDPSATNIYSPEGTAVQQQWAPQSRTVSANAQDYIGLTVKYRFAAGTNLFSGTLLTASSSAQLEPASSP